MVATLENSTVFMEMLRNKVCGGLHSFRRGTKNIRGQGPSGLISIQSRNTEVPLLFIPKKVRMKFDVIGIRNCI